MNDTFKIDGKEYRAVHICPLGSSDGDKYRAVHTCNLGCSAGGQPLVNIICEELNKEVCGYSLQKGDVLVFENERSGAAFIVLKGAVYCVDAKIEVRSLQTGSILYAHLNTGLKSVYRGAELIDPSL